MPLASPSLISLQSWKARPTPSARHVEVPPVFEVKAFDGLTAERDVWSASNDVVAHELTHLAENFATYEAVDGRDVTELTDSIVFDYAGKVDDVAFEGGTAEGASLILGSNQFIPGFEDQCVGQKVGETFDVNVTFPEDYQSTELAGKAAVFTCTISEIRSKVIPEVEHDAR